MPPTHLDRVAFPPSELKSCPFLRSHQTQPPNTSRFPVTKEVGMSKPVLERDTSHLPRTSRATAYLYVTHSELSSGDSSV